MPDRKSWRYESPHARRRRLRAEDLERRRSTPATAEPKPDPLVEHLTSVMVKLTEAVERQPPRGAVLSPDEAVATLAVLVVVCGAVLSDG